MGHERLKPAVGGGRDNDQWEKKKSQQMVWKGSIEEWELEK